MTRATAVAPSAERAGELARLRAVAGAVPDPELPVVTLADLGILRDVSFEGERIVVTITPTYSGCPAMRQIAADVVWRLREAGATDPQVRTVLAPAWTTDWITSEGRRKLLAAGIAPPAPTASRPAGHAPVPVRLGRPVVSVSCPRCGSSDTEQLAAFSATACTAACRCSACGEPFDRVKEL